VGCYTSESEIKKNNRLSEAALITCEKITSLGSILWGVAYPSEKLTSAWKKVLFLQFHDSLAGSSLVSHSQDAREGFGYALDIAHSTTCLALQKLEWQIAAEDPDSSYWVVFNSHAWPVKAHIRYDTYKETESIVVTDADNQPLPHQWVLGESQTGRRAGLVISVDLPAMGYQQIRIQKGEPLQLKSRLKRKDIFLKMNFIIVRFSSNGTVGVVDKETGEELFAEGMNGAKGVVIDDPSDAWGHRVKTYDREIGAFGEANIKVLERGPLKATTRVISTYGYSRLTIDWTLYSGSRRIEAVVSLDWHEKMKMLKISFPLQIDAPQATYEIPYGFIERQTNGDEDPGQRWMDLTGKRGNEVCGLTLINDAKYGYSIVGNDMRISITRSHRFLRIMIRKNWIRIKEYVYMDQGITDFPLDVGAS
jgi:alpha-mannosidase